MRHYFTNGELRIRANEEDDGYYHLYSIQLGYLDEYSMPNKPKIKRFSSLTVGRKMAKRFIRAYLKNIEDELEEMEK